jgi:hypothetical protein
VTDAHDQPNLDDIMETFEDARPSHREHAKAPPRPSEEELDRRAEIEREEVGLEGDDSDG